MRCATWLPFYINYKTGENKTTCGVVLFIYFDTQVLLLASLKEFSHVQGCEIKIWFSFSVDALELSLHWEWCPKVPDICFGWEMTLLNVLDRDFRQSFVFSWGFPVCKLISLQRRREFRLLCGRCFSEVLSRLVFPLKLSVCQWRFTSYILNILYLNM